MIYLLLFIGLVLVIFFHQLLLNVIRYRWLINSIIYPWIRFKLKRKIKKASADDINVMYLNLDMSKRWFDEYWFAKRVKKILSNAVESSNLE